VTNQFVCLLKYFRHIEAYFKQSNYGSAVKSSVSLLKWYPINLQDCRKNFAAVILHQWFQPFSCSDHFAQFNL